MGEEREIIRRRQMSDSERRTPELTSLSGSHPKGSELQWSEYNYEHFRLKHLLADLLKTVRGGGWSPVVSTECPTSSPRS